MLAVLNHPSLVYNWFTTVLLRWDGGLVIYDRWLLNFLGISDWSGGGGEVLLDFYYSCYLIAFLGVLFFFHRFRKQGWIKVQPHVPYDAMLVAMVGVLVGAKTAYIFIYNPEFYFGAPPYGPADFGDQMRRIFLNWSGMASHGAAAGVLIACTIWWLRSRPPIAHIGDIGAISSAFGAMWIRLANFMNGELYGRAASADLPWAMRFPVRSGKGHQVILRGNELFERIPKPEDPEKYTAWLDALKQANPDGVIDAGTHVLFRNPEAYLQGYELKVQVAGGAFEYMSKAPEPAPGTIVFGIPEYALATTPRHPSQLYQLLLEGLLLLIVLLWLRRRVTRAGMLAGAFWFGYPLARFIGEFWRQPDVQFQQAGNELGTVLFGLSMGQILSLIMSCIGLGFLIYFGRKGRLISEMKMWPPEKPKAASETASGESTSVGELSGLTELRAALAKKEDEWRKGSSKEKP